MLFTVDNAQFKKEMSMLKIFSSIHINITSSLTKVRRLVNRKRLTNQNFSLMVSNCTGGIIYHELGLNFLSPFINLQMNSAEFIRLMLNLKYYMSLELDFYTSEKWSCPVARLGDVTIIFTHYKNEEEARRKWNERKKRINYENIYVITNDNEVSEDDIYDFEKLNYKNYVIFTSKEYPDCPHAVFLKDFAGTDGVAWSFNRSKIMGSQYYERVFDYVGFLNSDHDDVHKYLKRVKI